AANGYGFFLMFLPYLSSAFVPVETMPEWLRPLAEHQPLTPIIETIRGLLLGTEIGQSGWWALGWCALILGVAVVLTRVLFRAEAGGGGGRGVALGRQHAVGGALCAPSRWERVRDGPPKRRGSARARPGRGRAARARARSGSSPRSPARPIRSRGCGGS